LNLANVMTVHRTAEEALRVSEDRFRSIFDHSNDAIFLFDPDLEEVVDANPKASSMLGYSHKELLGMPVSTLHPNDIDALREFSMSVFSQGHGQTQDLTCTTKDARSLPIEVSASLLEFEGRRCMLALVRDVTERKQLQAELLQAQKMEVIGRLAGGVAHDFNNLLTGIIGYSEFGLAALPNGGTRVRTCLEEIQNAAQRAAEFTQQLLTFSRRQKIEPKTMSLDETVSGVDKILHRLVSAETDLEIVTDSAPWLVKADPGQIENVLFNMAVNARDAISNGGKLTIETSTVTLDQAYAVAHMDASPGDHVMLSVKDTGSGMTDDVKARIFEPFFTTKEVGKGTGLGLSTCYGIVAHSGGHIAVESKPGLGTTFKVFLPRVSGVPNNPPQEDPLRYLARGNETVMLVEDDPAVREVMSHSLTEFGYMVYEASNGREALELVEQQSGLAVSVLLTDLFMPKMGGKDLAYEFSRRLPNTKVLYTSGYLEDAKIDQAALTKENWFIQKPFTPTELAGKLREILDRN
jgi:two-component system, cell cycle sensor histidine kinase and response regulator CckA